MNKLKTEQILYMLVFLLALAIRFLNLGEAPISDFEAKWALQSLGLANGESVNLSAQPGYIFPTMVFFSQYQATNFVARFWPALVGSFMVLTPFAFRYRLGQKTALIVALGLALDPGMVALSRLSGGPMPAIAFAVLAFAMLYAGRSMLGGILIGMALLSGYPVLLGVIGFGIAVGIARLLGIFKNVEFAANESSNHSADQDPNLDWRTVFLFGIGTVLLFGTFFFRHPQGLGALAATLGDFAQGWAQPSSIPAGRLLAAIIFYATLGLVFGLVTIVRGWLKRQPTAKFLTIWFLTALILPLLYPARQVGDVAWALLPLWALAGLELARAARLRDNWLISLGQAGALLVLMIVIWLTLSGFDTAIPETILNYWLVIGAAVLIGILILALVYLGWDRDTAWTGLVWGLAAGLGLYSLAGTFWVSQVRPNSAVDLWFPTPVPGHVSLLTHTLEDLALSQTGHAKFIEVLSLVDTTSMQWALRNFEGVTFASSIGSEDNPLIVITGEENRMESRHDTYRGQDFGWWITPTWGGVLPEETLNWIINRQGFTITQKVVLWARVDLFPEEPEAVEEPTSEIEGQEPSPLMDEGVENKE
jgi:hypothetical protein